MECDKYQEQNSYLTEEIKQQVVVVGLGAEQQVSSDASESHVITHAPDMMTGLEYAERVQARIIFLFNPEQAERDALYRILQNAPHLEQLVCSELEPTDWITAPLIENLSTVKKSNRWI